MLLILLTRAFFGIVLPLAITEYEKRRIRGLLVKKKKISPVVRQVHDLLSQCCTLGIRLCEIHWQNSPKTQIKGRMLENYSVALGKKTFWDLMAGEAGRLIFQMLVCMLEMFSPPTTWVLFLNGKWLTVEAQVNSSVMFQHSWAECVYTELSRVGGL